jgi:hypothetical protein
MAGATSQTALKATLAYRDQSCGALPDTLLDPDSQAWNPDSDSTILYQTQGELHACSLAIVKELAGSSNGLVHQNTEHQVQSDDQGKDLVSAGAVAEGPLIVTIDSPSDDDLRGLPLLHPDAGHHAQVKPNSHNKRQLADKMNAVDGARKLARGCKGTAFYE